MRRGCGALPFALALFGAACLLLDNWPGAVLLFLIAYLLA